MTDGYYTPGGNVTNGFDIQTPSAVHDGTAALSSDYTRADGTVFTGERGARPRSSPVKACLPEHLRVTSLGPAHGYSAHACLPCEPGNWHWP